MKIVILIELLVLWFERYEIESRENLNNLCEESEEKSFVGAPVV